MSISNNPPLIDGWINQQECDLVLKYMKLDTGTILETGSAIGRLFDYLFEYFVCHNYLFLFLSCCWKYSESVKSDWVTIFLIGGDMLISSTLLS